MAAAVWFPRARSVELRTEDLSETGPDEVRVRAALSAISHGTEMLVYRGEVDPGWWLIKALVALHLARVRHDNVQVKSAG